VNDRETLIAMLKRANIAYTHSIHQVPETPNLIFIEAGYAGFFVEIQFDLQTGSLQTIKAWE
jgi:hypothetical protein